MNRFTSHMTKLSRILSTMQVVTGKKKAVFFPR
jgi:hypothetical protein